MSNISFSRSNCHFYSIPNFLFHPIKLIHLFPFKFFPSFVLPTPYFLHRFDMHQCLCSSTFHDTFKHHTSVIPPTFHPSFVHVIISIFCPHHIHPLRTSIQVLLTFLFLSLSSSSFNLKYNIFQTFPLPSQVLRVHK
jgi:hypothetical protein